MIKSNLLIFSVMLLLCPSCGLHIQEADGATGPVVVYKTKKDYRNHVSVQLSADGNTITAYAENAHSYTVEDLLALVIDKNPYLDQGKKVDRL